MNNNIIQGYKGILDLDLSLIPEMYHTSVIKQHYKDIEEYKKYQKTLKPENRYENTIEKIQIQIENENNLRKQQLKEQQDKRYEHYNKLYKLNSL